MGFVALSGIMKIRPCFDSSLFSLWPSRPAHLSRHAHHEHTGWVQRPECAEHRRDCDDRRGGRGGLRDSCAFPRQTYQDYLHKQNLREHDRFESCAREDACRQPHYERPESPGHRDAGDVYGMPRIGDVSKSEFNRVVQRAVQTYLVRTITNTGGAIDLFA